MSIGRTGKGRGNKKRPPVIAITGTPGSGKTTLSRIASDELGFGHIDITRLVLSERESLGSGWDAEKKTVIADIPATRKTVLEIVHSNEDGAKGFLVDGHFSSEVCDPDLVVVLRCPPAKLYERLHSRPAYSEHKIVENVVAECLDCCFVHAKKASKTRRVPCIEIETAGTRVENGKTLIEAITTFLSPVKRKPSLFKKGAGASSSRFDYTSYLLNLMPPD